MPTRERKVPIRRVREFAATRKLFLLGVFLIAQVIFFNSSMFHLQNVFVRGNDRLNEEAVRTQASLPLQAHLARLPVKAAEERVSQMHWVKSAVVERYLPSTAVIRVVERKPVLAVTSAGEEAVFPGDWVVVSEDGWVLAGANARVDERLPRVRVDVPLRVGGRINTEIVESARACLAGLPSDLADQVRDLRADGSGQMTLTLDLKPEVPIEVRVGGADKLPHKYQVLEALIGRLRAEGKPVRYVDLRFSDAVVGYPPSPSASPGQGAIPE